MMGGIMEVTVVGARDLKNSELFGKVDPYVLVKYENEEQKSTTGRRRKTRLLKLKCCNICRCRQGQGGRRAVWDEKFKFKVDYFGFGVEQQQQQHQHKLLLKIMDHDSFTDDDCLGQATIYLKELFEVGMEKGKAELSTQKYRIVSSDKTYRGEIQVGITFTITGEGEGGIDEQELVDDGMKAKATK